MIQLQVERECRVVKRKFAVTWSIRFAMEVADRFIVGVTFAALSDKGQLVTSWTANMQSPQKG
tara:strand:- start:5385 stop:5573 length:189 start_codon:yes stop_codon:yes gene_type:complete